MLNKKIFFACVGLAVLAVIALVIRNDRVYRTEVSQFELTASSSDGAGISPQSYFILKTTAALTPQVLEKYIKLSPVFDFSIDKVLAQENTYEIKPNEPLAPNQVYTLKIDAGPLASRDFSWAYQVKAPFQMLSSLPADKAVGVPVNTGIELEFNRDISLDPSKYITFAPAAPGSFDVVGSKVRFIPTVPLNDRTIYTVTIKPGLTAKNSSDVFEQERVVRFETGRSYDESKSSILFGRTFSEFKPGADVVMSVDAYKVSSADVAVYRFNSAQEFIHSAFESQSDTAWSYYARIKNRTFQEDRKVFSGTIPVERPGQYDSYLRIPKQEVGYYAMVVTNGSNTDVAWFQVNPVSSFVAFSSKNTLVWIKDGVTGKSVPGVSVLFADKQLGVTGVDGVALVDTPSEFVKKSSESYGRPVQKFLVARGTGVDLVIPFENEYGSAASLYPSNEWWSYISLNKNIYLPTDSVRFWAIEKPRNAAGLQGEKISAKLTNPYWLQDQGNIVTYAESEVTVSEYGALTGELSFADLKPGLYELTFSKDSQIIAKTTVTVSAYVRPAYKILVTPDKNAVFAGESIRYNVQAQFFEGTPVAGVKLSYSAYGGGVNGKSGSVTLDENGRGTFVITPQYSQGEYTYWPSYLGVTVRPTNAEEGQIETNSSVFVFGPHVSTSIEQKQSSSQAEFLLKTRSITLSGVASGKPTWNSETYLGEPATGVRVHVDVQEAHYYSEQTGTGYDPINKLTYPIVNYRVEYSPVASKDMVSDQAGASRFALDLVNQKTYKLTFTTYDSAGRTDVDTRYVYGGGNEDRVNGRVEANYYLQGRDGAYKIGDPINLTLQTEQGKVPSFGAGNYLFMAVYNGAIEYNIQNTPYYNSTFREKDVPNVGIWPAWFTNGRFHNSYAENLSFDANERRLSISVQKDKNSYKPGDSVTLDIRVTDKNNKPVKAEVNISALDEAVFSLRPNERDIVNELYQDMYSQLVIRTSHKPPYGGGGAEKGGGDDGTPRSNLQEMALFKSVETDWGGNARVQFKLPDNITSWRVTTQAVTKDLYAEKSISFIPVSLPFFVDATFNQTYLAGDQVTLRARTFGVGAQQSNVSYVVESATLPFKKINLTGLSSVDVPLGKVTAGEHAVTIRAASGTYSDALTRSLRVVESYFTKTSSDFYEGVSGLHIQNKAKGSTTLMFLSLGRGQLYSTLKSYTYAQGVRLDQKLAQNVALKLLNDYFGEHNEVTGINLSNYQTSNGGLRLIPYGDEELELSALAAGFVDNSLVDTALLKQYFYHALSDTKTDISRTTRALYGLAVLHEPVLTKIQAIKAHPSLNMKDRVFVALALDAVGAKEDARVYYQTSIRPDIEVSSKYAYIDGLDGDDTVTTTALTAALTTNIGAPESSKLAFYSKSNPPKETLQHLQRLLYVKALLPKLDSNDVEFSYKTSAKSATKTLMKGEPFTLTLLPQELATFELTAVKGSLGVSAVYEETQSPQNLSKDKNLELKRFYEIRAQEGDSLVQAVDAIHEGDLVLVRLVPVFTSKALNGLYQVVDYVPSGLRPIDEWTSNRFSSYEPRNYPIEVKDQKVTFIVDRQNNKPIYYYARVVSKGTYKAEPALLQSLRNLESATVSHEDSILIK